MADTIQPPNLYLYRYKKTISWDGENFDPEFFKKEYDTFVSQIKSKNPEKIPQIQINTFKSNGVTQTSYTLDPNTDIGNLDNYIDLTPDIQKVGSNKTNAIELLYYARVRENIKPSGFGDIFGDVSVQVISKIENTKPTNNSTGATYYENGLTLRGRKEFYLLDPSGYLYKSIYNRVSISLIDNIKKYMTGVKVIENKEFRDPNPQLPGPPSLNSAGLKKPAEVPSINNPSISSQVTSLPQEAKQTNASIAEKAADSASKTVNFIDKQVNKGLSGAANVINTAQNSINKAVSAVNNTVGAVESAVEGVVGGVVGAVEGVVGGAVGAVTGTVNSAAGAVDGAVNRTIDSVGAKLNPKGITPDGLNNQWSPDKYSPESISGKTTKINPITGAITGGILGAGVGAAVGAIKGGKKGALTGAIAGGTGGLAIGALSSIGGTSVPGGILSGAVAGAGAGVVAGLASNLVSGKKPGSNLGKSAAIGAVGGAVVGGTLAAAKSRLTSIKNSMPKPKVDQPLPDARVKIVTLKSSPQDPIV